MRRVLVLERRYEAGLAAIIGDPDLADQPGELLMREKDPIDGHH